MPFQSLPDALASVSGPAFPLTETDAYGTRISPVLPRPYDGATAFTKGFAQTFAPLAGAEVLMRWADRPRFQPRPGYNPYNDTQIAGVGDLGFFAGAVSPEETAYRLKQLRNMQDSEARLNRSGASAGFGRIVGALLSPDQLIAAAALGPLAGPSRLANALRAGGLTALAAPIDYAAVAAASPAHDFGDPLYNTMGAIFANTFFGAIGKAGVSTMQRSQAFVRDLAATERMAQKSLSVGAMDNPYGELLNRADRLWGDAAASAYGAEKIPVNPIIRLLKSPAETARNAIARLTEIPFFQNKNFTGEATSLPVWARYRELRGAYGDALDQTDRLYAEQLQRLASQAGQEAPQGFFQRLRAAHVGTDYAGTKAAFYREVGQAKSALGTAEEAAFSPEAVKAAKIWDEQLYKPIADLGHLSGALTYGAERDLETVAAKIERAQAQGEAETVAKLRQQQDELKGQIDQLKAQGVYKPDYLNRIWLTSAVKANRAQLEEIIAPYLGGDRQAASEAVDHILHEQPFTPVSPDQIGRAGSLHERSLAMVPDSALNGFLERNISIAGQKYIRGMGVDSLLANEFGGEVDLRATLKEVEAEHKKLIAAATGEKARLNATAAMERDLEDIRAVRDLVRGTYGLAKDPQAWTSRAIRLAKAWNVMSQLTGFVSALPDLARLPMTEGLHKAFGDAFKQFVKRGATFHLAEKELKLAGEALDVAMGLRAATMADIVDSFSTAGKIERLIQHGANASFLINGMNHWTDAVKTIGSMVIGTRIIEDVRLLAAGKAGKGAIAKLARGHIDEAMAIRIVRQLDKHGLEDGNLKFANTAAWTDKEAASHFRGALAKDVNIAVVTPAPGEKPLWMSTELGSLLTQYKGFGMASTMRVMLPGLQAPDRNFLLGAIALVGMGGLVDMLQTRRRGSTYGAQGPLQTFANAVDRSGLLGYFMDTANMIEGVGKGVAGSNFDRALGAVGGPTVGTVLNALRGFAGDGANPMTHQARRQMLPYARVWQFDPIFDHIAGT